MTFYPGPSKVYPQVAKYLQEAFAEGILSVNHRSVEGMEITRGAIEGLRKKLNIPDDYFVYFISSATEAWEIIAQSLTRQKSLQFYNGAFGEKWADYAEKLILGVERIPFGIDELPDLQQIRENGRNFPNVSNFREVRPRKMDKSIIPQPFKSFNDVVCITQNETSNGTQIKDLKPFKKAFPEAIIAVDATSSLGGIDLEFKDGDVWFASVQKCLGLPAGMAIMICSPKAIERAREINDRKYYNSLLFIHDNFQKNQTHYTPNMLNIYLINKIILEISNISIISESTKQRAIEWYDFFENVPQTSVCKSEEQTKVCVTNPEVRSDTVITIEGTEEQIKQIKSLTKANGITVGNGYGSWKNTTFRIANFPAIEDFEIEALKKLLS
jgi:phosphoserine aminotransferase